MKKYIFSLVCLCCALLPALEGQAALHEHPEYPELYGAQYKMWHE